MKNAFSVTLARYNDRVRSYSCTRIDRFNSGGVLTVCVGAFAFEMIGAMSPEQARDDVAGYFDAMAAVAHNAEWTGNAEPMCASAATVVVLGGTARILWAGDLDVAVVDSAARVKFKNTPHTLFHELASQLEEHELDDIDGGLNIITKSLSEPSPPTPSREDLAIASGDRVLIAGRCARLRDADLGLMATPEDAFRVLLQRELQVLLVSHW